MSGQNALNHSCFGRGFGCLNAHSRGSVLGNVHGCYQSVARRRLSAFEPWIIVRLSRAGSNCVIQCLWDALFRVELKRKAIFLDICFFVVWNGNLHGQSSWTDLWSVIYEQARYSLSLRALASCDAWSWSACRRLQSSHSLKSSVEKVGWDIAEQLTLTYDYNLKGCNRR